MMIKSTRALNITTFPKIGALNVKGFTNDPFYGIGTNPENGDYFGLIVLPYVSPTNFEPELGVSVHNYADTLCSSARSFKQSKILIVAVGYASFDENKSFANYCEAVDLVVGGNDDTFLYTGHKPSDENPIGYYPHEVIHPVTKKKILVVATPPGSKYLGKITFTADLMTSQIISSTGNPILLDASIPEDEDMKRSVRDYRRALARDKELVLARSKVLLRGSRCRFEECNLGNIVADAVVFDRSVQYRGANWTDVPISLIHGSSFKSDIDARNGSVTYGAVLEAVERSPLYIVTLTGVQLYQVFERAVQEQDGEGHYVQSSGLQVVVDRHYAEARRVASISALCADCPVPRLRVVELNRRYRVLATEFLVDGNDGFDMFLEAGEALRLNVRITNCVTEYLFKRKFVYPPQEGRVVFVSSEFRSGSWGMSARDVVLFVVVLVGLY